MYVLLGAFPAFLSLATVSAGVVLPAGQVPLRFLPAKVTKNIISELLYDDVAALLKNNSIPGYAVALIKLGEDEEFEFASWGNQTEAGDKLTPQTLYNLASVSKAFTATSVGILIDDFANGRNVTALPDGLQEFTWSTKVKDILPDLWKLMDPLASSNANIWDILSHVSGLPRHDVSYGPGDSAIDIVSRLRYLRPAYELREKWHYNNLMYILSAHLIARYSATDFPTFVSERIFAPLGMNQSTYWPSNAYDSGNLTESWSATGRRIAPTFSNSIVDLMAGAGGVFSSAADMARWAQFVLSVATGREGAEKMGVPVSAVQHAIIPHALVLDMPKEGYGLTAYGTGWFVGTYQGHKIIEHGGSIPGISSLVSLFPDDDFAIVQLSNADGKGWLNHKVLMKMVEAALGVPPPSEVHKEDHRSRKTSPSASPTKASRMNVLSLEAYAGTYIDPAYGSFTLCAPTSTSQYCDSVISTFRAVNSSITDKPVLLGRWKRVFADHIHLVRTDDEHRFLLDLPSLFPEGYGRDKTPFQSSLLGHDPDGPNVQFVVENQEVVGLGLFGLIGEETERQRVGKTVEGRAEAWFRRV